MLFKLNILCNWYISVLKVSEVMCKEEQLLLYSTRFWPCAQNTCEYEAGVMCLGRL